MPTLVRQPNGLLAVFSSNPDDFIAGDMTPAEYVRWRADAVAKDAARAVEMAERRAVEALDALPAGDTARFEAAIDRVETAHGKARAKRRRREMSTAPPAQPPPPTRKAKPLAALPLTPDALKAIGLRAARVIAAVDNGTPVDPDDTTALAYEVIALLAEHGRMRR